MLLTASGGIKKLFSVLTKCPFSALACQKQGIKGSTVNFICETKSVSKQDALILLTCSCKILQITKTIVSKLATFPYIY